VLLNKQKATASAASTCLGPRPPQKSAASGGSASQTQTRCSELQSKLPPARLVSQQAAFKRSGMRNRCLECPKVTAHWRSDGLGSCCNGAGCGDRKLQHKNCAQARGGVAYEGGVCVWSCQPTILFVTLFSLNWRWTCISHP